ncbi:hypothetical protein [Nocardia alni]|uniref:hypothetical protein n=1 Tax=Nocardia alni TaxID=2815723 RepID=UPI001C23B1CE|nr:hypothetical protein [Nocardia alni]
MSSRAGVSVLATLRREELSETVRVGLIGGFVGAVCIWIYEAIVWVGVQHQMPMKGIPANATGLTFGQSVQSSLGVWAYVLGTIIHVLFALIWGVVFAVFWPWFRRHGVEATLVALPYAIILWILMHVGIIIVSNYHPNYGDSTVVIGGFMSHFCYAVPMALVVKHLMAQRN